jgi:hypothetical protein
MAPGPRPPKGTLGGSNRMLSSRDVAAILAIPERTVRDKWVLRDALSHAGPRRGLDRDAGSGVRLGLLLSAPTM